MWLITCNCWSGPGREDYDRKTTVRIQTHGFATRRNLPEALQELKKYIEEFNSYFKMTSIDYQVVSASEIPELSDDDLAAGSIELIDTIRARSSWNEK